jgi:adenylate cyclase
MNYFVKAAGILFFSLTVFFVQASTDELDSLKNRLHSSKGIVKINLNYLIGSQYINSIPDSAIYYYGEGLELSKVLRNDTFEAKCLNKIGVLKFNSGDYETAITNLYKALKIFERYQDKNRLLRCLQYLGMAYNQQGMYDQALDYTKQSLELAKINDDIISEAVSLGTIGSIYYSQSRYDDAVENFQHALHIMEEAKYKPGIADALNNVASIYEEKKDFDKALEYHLRSLALQKELNDDAGIAASYNNIGRVYQGMKKYPVAIEYLDSSIALAKEGDDKFYLKESYNNLSGIYSDAGDFEMAYKTHLLFSELNDTLMSEANKRQFAEMNTKYETEKKDNQINLLNKDGEKQKIIRNGFMGGFAIVLLFAGIFFTQRNKIKKGKQRSDELLLNILPEETAEELKETGEARAKYFDEVTVMFTDFKNFSHASEKLSPSELVKEIHHCYSEFDKIVTRHGLEKIKTIGDSYMCAGGLPVPNKTCPEDTVKAALEIADFMSREKEKGEAEGKPYFEVRIGCHTGPVVAGIVGIKKFAYDIWGDTVNIAARMEQNSEAGKINISGTTYELVKNKFKCIHRGKVSAKNKGEIDMYFVS